MLDLKKAQTYIHYNLLFMIYIENIAGIYCCFRVASLYFIKMFHKNRQNFRISKNTLVNHSFIMDNFTRRPAPKKIVDDSWSPSTS